MFATLGGASPSVPADKGSTWTHDVVERPEEAAGKHFDLASSGLPSAPRHSGGHQATLRILVRPRGVSATLLVDAAVSHGTDGRVTLDSDSPVAVFLEELPLGKHGQAVFRLRGVDPERYTTATVITIELGTQESEDDAFVFRTPVPLSNHPVFIGYRRQQRAGSQQAETERMRSEVQRHLETQRRLLKARQRAPTKE